MPASSATGDQDPDERHDAQHAEGDPEDAEDQVVRDRE
jgi:hypothetical protein